MNSYHPITSALYRLLRRPLNTERKARVSMIMIHQHMKVKSEIGNSLNFMTHQRVSRIIDRPHLYHYRYAHCQMTCRPSSSLLITFIALCQLSLLNAAAQLGLPRVAVFLRTIPVGA